MNTSGMNIRYLHLGSWNIEHLSRQNDNREESPYALAEHIEMGGLDILALQELYVTHTENGRRRNSDLDETFRLIEEHTDHLWEYEIYPNRNAGDKSQLCGVAWNPAKIENLGSYPIPVSTGETGMRLWDRLPHAVKFKFEKKTDIVVISVHMKSNVGGVQLNRKKRHMEAKTLVENLPKVVSHFKDEDIVILGDFNVLNGAEPAVETIIDAGFIDLNAADAPTHGKAPFDRVFVPMNEKEFKYSRQYVMLPANPHDHDRFLSDHSMIKVPIKLLVDDD